ncbi:hypothetical protein [Kitasatospora sp. NPDC056184]|uniref:hypothetical protein n=1 Tax=Kitasatospora sp. NPDC056184 TaxID=3345738 RepID=UPI0035E246C3
MPETAPPERIDATLPAVDGHLPVQTGPGCPKDCPDGGSDGGPADRPDGGPDDRPDAGPRCAARARPGRTRHRVITAVQIAVFAVGSALGLAGGIVALRHGNGLQLFAASAFLFGAATVLQFFRPQSAP